jgi:hypothetical protein
VASESEAGADRLDRAAVMIEARRQYQIMQPLAGWTFARCLRHAWAKGRQAAQTPQS